MTRSSFALCVLTLLAGCNHVIDSSSSSQSSSEPPSGLGRFAHSAIHRAIAPWDGPATALVLGENALVEGKLAAPYVSIRINRSYTELSKQKLRIDGTESKVGSAQFLVKEGETGVLSWVEVEFEEIREGKPVHGTYDAAFPDGTHARGQFQADWWKSEGFGG